jgi:NADH-quinone oxidoreductase subunit G
MAEFEIEINGHKVRANAGEMLIQVTDREEISVPRFCYHKKLSIAANCRMCLVDVEGAPKPQPACSTPVSQGMKVHTQNEKTKKSQQAVMEFLLINHPLDCPICDQGGECELQDVAMDYGSDISRFSEGKRILPTSDIGALIQTDMTRCIHCTRCVRFGAEIAGVMEMGGTGRGEQMKIEPFLDEGVQSELSGNMIDVCPVGALTSKPFRYELRSWQMRALANIARHDLVGSNIYTQTYKGRVKRVVARDNEAINETWISDRDRFSYEGLASDKRLLAPQIKVAGQWKKVDWEVALDFAVKGLNNHVLNNRQADKLGALATTTATTEEYYLLQKLLRKVGCENLDYRLNVKNLDNAIQLHSNIELSAMEKLDEVLIIGANIRLEQPLINHRLRKAQLAGASITALNVKAFEFNYQAVQISVSPTEITHILAAILTIILTKNQQDLPDYLSSVKPSAVAERLAEKLLNADNSLIILGEHLINTESAATIANLVAEIAKQTHASTLNLSITANALGAQRANFTPAKTGLNANAMLAADMRAFLLLDVYPEYDFHHLDTAMNALSKDDVFVLALNSFDNEAIRQCADVMLPMAAAYETSGSHININHQVQSFQAAVRAPSESKPAWKILKVLADLLELPNFHYENSTQILDELLHQPTPSERVKPVIKLQVNSTNIETIWMSSAYQSDAVLRHSKSLAATPIGQMHHASMNAAAAKKLKLEQADKYLGVPVIIDNTVAKNCVFVSANRATDKEQL